MDIRLPVYRYYHIWHMASRTHTAASRPLVFRGASAMATVSSCPMYSCHNLVTLSSATPKARPLRMPPTGYPGLRGYEYGLLLPQGRCQYQQLSFPAKQLSQKQKAGPGDVLTVV